MEMDHKRTEQNISDMDNCKNNIEGISDKNENNDAPEETNEAEPFVEFEISTLKDVREKTSDNREENCHMNVAGGGDDDGDGEDVEQSDSGDDLPIDKGWAWIILFGKMMAGFIIVGHLKSFGITFLQQQTRFGSSSSETALIQTMQGAAFSLAALLVMTLGGSVSPRLNVYLGAVMSLVTYFVAAFITTIGAAYFFLGIVTGVSNAVMFLQFITMLSMYFNKYRGFANSVGQSGVSLGGLVMAPFLTYLFEEYGYTGTYMLIAAFHFNVAVFGTLLWPLSNFRRKNKSIDTCAEGNDLHKPLLNVDNNKDLAEDLAKSQNNNSTRPNSMDIPIGRQNCGLERQINGTKKLTVKRHPRLSNIKSSEHEKAVHKSLLDLTLSNSSLFNSSIARFPSTDVINTSILNLTLIDRLENQKTPGAEDNPNGITTKFKILVGKLFSIKLLSKPEFLYFLLCNFFVCAGSATVTAFLPQFCEDLGINKQTAAWLMAGTNVLEFINRLVFGYISDKQWCHRSTIVALSALVIGVVAQSSYFMTSLSTIIAYSVITGFLQGVYFSLYPVLILDILTFDDFKGALGFVCLVQGITNSIAFPVAGLLRDITGSYYLSFNYIGLMCLIGGILTYFLPNVHNWSVQHRKHGSTSA